MARRAMSATESGSPMWKERYDEHPVQRVRLAGGDGRRVPVLFEDRQQQRHGQVVRFQPAEQIAVLPLLDHLEQRRAELHGVMGLQLDRYVDPVQVAEPWLDQMRMRRETDLPAPGGESLLPSGVVEDIEVDVGGDRLGETAQRVERVRLDQAEIAAAEQQLLPFDHDLALPLLDVEEQVVEEAARRGVPRPADGEVGLADVGNDWTRKHAACLVSRCRRQGRHCGMR